MFCTSSRWRWEPRANVLPAPAFLMNKFRCDEIIFAYYQLYVYAYYGWSPCKTLPEASRNFASFRSRIDSFSSFLDFSNEEADGKAKFNVVLSIIKLIDKIYSFRRRVQFFFFFFYCFIEFFVELIMKKEGTKRTNPPLKCIDFYSGRRICGLITSCTAFVQKKKK